MITETFPEAIKKEIDEKIACYETKRASLLEVLRILMEHHGFITLEMEVDVADYLEIAAIDVREVMTFYTLFYTKPRAKTRFHVCRSLSCHLLGASEIVQYLEEKLGVKCGHASEDGEFAVDAVECLGACELAPMMQMNDCDYHGFLTKEKIDEILERVRKGEVVTSEEL